MKLPVISISAFRGFISMKNSAKLFGKHFDPSDTEENSFDDFSDDGYRDVDNFGELNDFSDEAYHDSVNDYDVESSEIFYDTESDEDSEPVIIPLDTAQIVEYLDETGSFASFFERYEVRHAQLDLTEEIANCFNNDSIGVFEAGTGVGKSLAYLIPAIKWALQNKERVVISTGTINLQQQLMEKDLPSAKKIIGKEAKDLKVLLLKGRHNYLCIRRLMQALQEPDLFNDDYDEIKKIQAWAATSADGSKAEMPFVPSDKVWAKVCAESDNCLGRRCPYYADSFVMKLKKEAAKASLLIVNHHLLFADLAARYEGYGYQTTAVLPPFKRLIFDEAHTMEDAAQSFFSKTFSQFELQRQINALYRHKKGKPIGVLPKLITIAHADEIVPEITKTLFELQTAYAVLDSEALPLCSSGAISFQQMLPYQRDALTQKLSAVRRNLEIVIQHFTALIDTVSDDEQSEDTVQDAKLILWRFRELKETAESFEQWKKLSEKVFWIEKIRSAQKETVRFHQTPLNLASLLHDAVFFPMRTVICLSATLKIGESFDYWLNRTGLNLPIDAPLITKTFPSPFPYKRNVLLNVPIDAPPPDDKEFQNWINKAIAEMIELSGGKTLVLFTSYESLKTACAHARAALKDTDLLILQQGEDDRSRLLNFFKENVSSSLFATTSFWAGIDVPGESLTHVILVKLPFSVPTDPVFKAKADAIDSAGGSSFMSLSVPEAVIQFRQGFGRLMRSQSDRGIVTLLDKRIIAKRYGQIFITSLPETRQCFDSFKNILYNIENFLF
ncbi:ATP-dependent DNA helicase [Treponema phagedenis]|uniref:ATP-dependent DNA helicase n=1 Tax=Treponema phagedenis TaxID=162 RepID=UPI001EE7362E|nr:helicase C-terminal domain-containing protein [Treponema phagedenis]